METEELQREHRLTYTRNQVIVIILIIVGVTVVIGNFTTTTTAVTTVSEGILSISENATCTGFGEPFYWNSMGFGQNFTSYAYGRCLFGFWVSNGVAVGSSSSTGAAL